MKESKFVLGVFLEFSRLVLSLQGSKGRGNPKISKLGSSQLLTTLIYTTRGHDIIEFTAAESGLAMDSFWFTLFKE